MLTLRVQPTLLRVTPIKVKLKPLPITEANGKSPDAPSTDHISDTDEEGEEEVPKDTQFGRYPTDPHSIHMSVMNLFTTQ